MDFSDEAGVQEKVSAKDMGGPKVSCATQTFRDFGSRADLDREFAESTKGQAEVRRTSYLPGSTCTIDQEGFVHEPLASLRSIHRSQHGSTSVLQTCALGFWIPAVSIYHIVRRKQVAAERG